MRTKFLLLLYVILFNLTISGETPEMATHNIMPVPEKIEFTGKTYLLDSTFTISVKGESNERLYSYSSRFLRRLSGRTGLFFTQDFISKKHSQSDASLLITYKRKGLVKLGEVESYTLKVEQNKIFLSAETDLGIFRGLETLLQLLSANKEGYNFPTVIIEDSPRFPWRGLMIDVCRHFMPIDMIKRNIDGMAALKMNVLHLHLSEDQGFRVESKSLPKLHELGSDGLYFTHEQIKEIIKYANDRGIRVMPEFDVPGHSTSWLTAYPELASLPGPYSIERNWGIFDPTFNPTIEETYEFFDIFFKEMAELFNDDYMHIGGDENNGKQWNQNEQIQKFMKDNNIKDNHALQSYFNNRLLKILTKYNKKMVGWDEILQPEMPTNIVIQSWRGQKSLIESAKQGYMGILSNGYYIDLIQPASFHYLNDPIPFDTPLNEKEQKFILGGEATMWAELVTNENVDSRIWPRTAAIAERFWSPANVRDVNDMYRRLEIISFQLEDIGLTHISSYELMLRRLTNNQDIPSLKTLTDVIEPVKIYTRHRQGKKYTSYSPYTRAVDAARPESDKARTFSNLVDEYLKTKSSETEGKIISCLKIWKSNHSLLVPIIDKSPILKEIEPLSANLSLLAEAGLEAINSIKDTGKLNAKWIEDKNRLIGESKVPYGQTELRIIEAVEKLIKAGVK